MANLYNKRGIQNTLPRIEDEDDLLGRKKSGAGLPSEATLMNSAKQQAAKRVVEPVPNVLPGEDAPPEGKLNYNVPVNTTDYSQFSSDNAIGSGGIEPPDRPEAPAPRPQGSPSDYGVGARVDPSNVTFTPPTNRSVSELDEAQGFDNPYATGAEVEEWDDLGITNRADYEKWKRGDIYFNANTGLMSDGSEGESGWGGINPNLNADEEEDDTFSSLLDQMLRDKMMEDPTEAARLDAGRALAAARSQAGRGQMGMSGGMLALQSDVMGEAARQAEDQLWGQQLQAGKLGAAIETEDRNRILSAIAVKEDLGMDDDAFRSFLSSVFPDMAEDDIEVIVETGMGTGLDDPSESESGEEQTIAFDDSIPSNYQDFFSGTVGGDMTGAEYYEGHIGFKPGLILPSDAQLPTGHGPRMFGFREITIDGEKVYFHMYKMEDENGNEYVIYTPTEPDQYNGIEGAE